MFGTTLRDMRRHVERLASDDGRYYLRCARTGDRPIPVAGKRFRDRALARIAVQVGEQYRAALRRYDPQLPYHDLIVCEADQDGRRWWRGRKCDDPFHWVETEPRGARREAAPEPRLQDRTRADRPRDAPERRQLVEYCHSVASAVFETLAASGYDEVETAVMDAYVELAGAVTDPDRLCLVLLESVAFELEAHLQPGEQAAVIARAADRLGPDRSAEAGVVETFERLQRVGLLDDYARSPWSRDGADGSRRVVVRLSNYVLSPRDGRLPVLPLVFAVHRTRTAWRPTAIAVERTARGVRVTLDLDREGGCEGDGEDGDDRRSIDARDGPPTDARDPRENPADRKSTNGPPDRESASDPIDREPAIHPDGLAAVPLRTRGDT